MVSTLTNIPLRTNYAPSIPLQMRLGLHVSACVLASSCFPRSFDTYLPRYSSVIRLTAIGVLLTQTKKVISACKDTKLFLFTDVCVSYERYNTPYAR